MRKFEECPRCLTDRNNTEVYRCTDHGPYCERCAMEETGNSGTCPSCRNYSSMIGVIDTLDDE